MCRYVLYLYNVGDLLEQRIGKARDIVRQGVLAVGVRWSAASCRLSIFQVHAIIYIGWKISRVRRRPFVSLRKGDIGKKRFRLSFPLKTCLVDLSSPLSRGWHSLSHIYNNFLLVTADIGI